MRAGQRRPGGESRRGRPQGVPEWYECERAGACEEEQRGSRAAFRRAWAGMCVLSRRDGRARGAGAPLCLGARPPWRAVAVEQCACQCLYATACVPRYVIFCARCAREECWRGRPLVAGWGARRARGVGGRCRGLLTSKTGLVVVGDDDDDVRVRLKNAGSRRCARERGSCGRASPWGRWLFGLGLGGGAGAGAPSPYQKGATP